MLCDAVVGLWASAVWLCCGWVSLATAQEVDSSEDVSSAVAAPSEPASEEEQGAEEVIVYSEYMVELARRELIGAARDAGYTKEIRRSGKTILRHDAVWHGEIVIHDTGLVEVKRQPIQFRPPFRRVTPASWLSCVIVPLCIRPNGQLVSPRRYRAYERTAWAAVEDEVSVLQGRISDLGTDRKVHALPERLERLWDQGIPLEGEVTLKTYDERRQALLAFWDSRTDTSWGDQVREVVVGFIRGVVQYSEHAFSPDDVADFERTKRSSRDFPSLRFPSAAP